MYSMRSVPFPEIARSREPKSCLLSDEEGLAAWAEL